MTKLDDKVVIVTGAGRGIGRAIAMACATEGARVAVADYGTALDGSAPDASIATSVAEEIKAKGGVAIAVSETVATRQGANAIIDATLSAWGRVDGVACCAGILRHAPFLQISEDDFDAVIATHLKGHFLMFQTAMGAMIKQGQGGSLIAIGSGYAMGDAGRASYRAAKAGIIGLAKSVALAGVDAGVRANVISPIADTRMTKASNILVGAGPDSIGPMSIYLLSDLASGITGEVFSVSGGSIGVWEDPYERRCLRFEDTATPTKIAENMPWLMSDHRGHAKPRLALPLASISEGSIKPRDKPADHRNKL
jgi:NAD(P)-dependent dehydrogenase (short-subunit alcohol dehydrogenase family)